MELDEHHGLLTEQQVADLLGVTRRALQAWRYRGRGPRFLRVGARLVRYRRADVEAFLTWDEGPTTGKGGMS